jgi:pimeloyl-ACP methyl ester carboxylesterase
MSTRTIVLCCGALLLAASCSDSSSQSGTDTTLSCPVVVADADCDKSQRPFVFVHGTFGSGDNFAHVASLLASNGFCADRIVAIEYNSLGDKPGTNGQLDAAIDRVLAQTGFTQVDLAGHSQGTAHCGAYMSDPAHAAKVAHYINFSGTPDVGDVETLSLSSQHDLGNTPHHATGTHVKTVTFTDQITSRLPRRPAVRRGLQVPARRGRSTPRCSAAGHDRGHRGVVRNNVRCRAGSRSARSTHAAHRRHAAGRAMPDASGHRPIRSGATCPTSSRA